MGVIDWLLNRRGAIFFCDMEEEMWSPKIRFSALDIGLLS